MARLVIFDLDDTLVDTRRATLKAFITIATRYVQPPTVLGFELLERWLRITWYFKPEDHFTAIDILRRELGQAPLTIAHRHDIERLYLSTFMENLQEVNGAAEMLSWLSELEIKLAIVSNGDDLFQREKIVVTRLQSYFRSDSIYVADGGFAAKPYSANFKQACRDAGVTPSDALVVGDRLTDVIGGNLAGCTTVHFLNENLDVRVPTTAGRLLVERPDYSIQSLRQLRGLVQNQ
jgi:HAD superfamily hydrolase (TIGR01549 family)